MRVDSLILSVKRLAVHLGLGFLLLQASCVAQQSSGNFSNEPYYEDLTAERIQFKSKNDTSASVSNKEQETKHPVAATHTVNPKVDAVLDSLDKLNQFRKFVDGFTIQIYSGQNREDAIAAKSKMVVEFSEPQANVQYTQPKFRVTAGQYFSKLEAQKDLMRIRYHFPNAILVPEKISVK